MLVAGLLFGFLAAALFIFFFQDQDLNQSWKVQGIKGHIQYDPSGYLHVRSDDNKSLFFLVGFIQAKERLVQLEILRLLNDGKLHLVTEKAAYFDKRSKFVHFGLDKLERELSKDEREILKFFADGINFYKKNHFLKLGLEYYVLPSQVKRPWSVRDILAMYRALGFELSTDMIPELNRYILAKRYGADKENQLRLPTHKEPYGHIFTASTDEESQKNFETLSADVVKSEYESKLHQTAVLEAPFEDLGDFQADTDLDIYLPGGSNAWALKGMDKGKKNVVMCNDPHLSYTNPSTWMLMRLTTPSFDVAGLVRPGLPYVLIGGTKEVAWGITMSYVDSQDIIVTDQNLNLPHLGTFGEKTAYLAWTPYYMEKEFRPLSFLSVYQARTASDFVAKLKDSVQSPILNFTIIDKDLSAIYRLNGKVPKRGSVSPYPQTQDWLGVEDQEFHAEQEKIISANQTIISTESSKELSYNFSSNSRAKRIDELLSLNSHNDLDQHFQFQLDSKAGFTDETLDSFNKLFNVSFDGDLNSNSHHAYLYELFRHRLTLRYLQSLDLDRTLQLYLHHLRPIKVE